MPEVNQQAELSRVAERLVERLRETNSRIVLAESCTGGLAAAAITAIPGVSSYFCGSAVTYRETTKDEWLGISRETISARSAESAEVTQLMAVAVLDRTTEADFAGAITGHLGPESPTEKDGVVFLAIATRNSSGEVSCTFEEECRLISASRASRQTEAAARLLNRMGDLANP